MKVKIYMKKIKPFIKSTINRAVGFMLLTFTSHACLADGIIPISTEDKAVAGTNFAKTIIDILKLDIIPLITVAAAIWVIWQGITTMSHGIKESRDRSDMGPLKEAILKTAIIVVMGGSLIFLLMYVKNFTG